jgi:hypothetical protein
MSEVLADISYVAVVAGAKIGDRGEVQNSKLKGMWDASVPRR